MSNIQMINKLFELRRELGTLLHVNNNLLKNKIKQAYNLINKLHKKQSYTHKLQMAEKLIKEAKKINRAITKEKKAAYKNARRSKK